MTSYQALQQAITRARAFANNAFVRPEDQQAIRLLANFVEEHGKRPRYVRLKGPTWEKTFRVHPGEGSGLTGDGIILAVTDPVPYPEHKKLCSDPDCILTTHYTDDTQCVTYKTDAAPRKTDTLTIFHRDGKKITHIHL